MTTQTNTISNGKIIFFVVFICAAIMTSLFVYHASQKPAKPVLASDVGFIFSVPRDIKSFKLETAGNEPFTEKNLKQHWTLLFFGFTHCSNVCPATFEMMKRAYPELHKQYPNLQVALVSVDPERDTVASVDAYTKNFNPDFIGVTGKIQEVRKLQSQMGVYAARDNNSPDTNYQVQHTSSIMLVNPRGQWVGLYKFGLKPDDFVNGVKAGVEG